MGPESSSRQGSRVPRVEHIHTLRQYNRSKVCKNADTSGPRRCRLCNIKTLNRAYGSWALRWLRAKVLPPRKRVRNLATCYSELVHAVPISMYFRHINQTLPRELLPIVKTTLREGLEVLAFLQSAKVRHQDLTFRNILIRAAGGTSTKPRVLFLDFGGSSWPPRAVPTPFTLASWVIGANLTRFRLRANTSHTFTTMLRHASTLAVGYPLL
jgi:serine/threonine protein kinase